MMMQSLIVFMQFFRRDYYVQIRHLKEYMINYAIIQPVLWAVVTGYLQANTYFGSSNITQNTILFSGTIVVSIMVITYTQAIELLFDFESVRYIDFQIIVLSPILVLIERILFSSLLTFVMVAPYYPISKMLLGKYIDTTNTSWVMVMLILYAGALCFSAYHLMASCILKSAASINTLWKRCNGPMIDFGGMWIPWIVIYTFSPTFGYLMYLNPLIYVSEGLKQAMIGGQQFFSFWFCICMLMAFTIVFTIGTWYFFKKRTDCL